jgi:hypothetical protein
MVRDKTPGERQDYQNSMNRVLGALDGKEVDLFGQADIDARNKRAEKRAAKEAGQTTKPAKAADKSDKNPKSDPKSGGAGKKGKDKAAGGQAPSGGQTQGDGTETPPAPAADDGKPQMIQDPVTGEERPETGDELIARVAREKNAELEQREGANALNGVGGKPVDNVVPMSQSQKAAAALKDAKLN